MTRAPRRPERIAARRRLGEPVGTILVAAVVCTMVCSPLLFSGRPFWDDWTNSLWLLDTSPTPTSVFVHNPTLGAFYPQFAFYGGPLYSAGKLLSLVLGDRPILAYLFVWTAAVAASYGAVLGIARRAGVPSRLAHVPSIAYVTAPYLLTNMYGRGAFSEFMATSSIPLLVYGIVSQVGDDRPPRRAIVAILVGSLLLTGSHMITLLYGSLFLLLLGLAAAIFARRWIAARRRRLWAVVATGALAVGLNAWYLGPALLLYGTTGAGTGNLNVGAPEAYTWLSSPGILLSPFPRVATESTTPGLFVQAPVVFLAWSTIALVHARLRGLRGVDWRLVVAVSALLAFLLALVSTKPLWAVLPSVFDYVQFPYRLLAYVGFATVGLCILALRCMAQNRAGRLPIAAALVAAVATTTALAAWQGWTTESRGHRREVALVGSDQVPRTWYDPFAYRDFSLPLLHPDLGRSMEIPTSRIADDRFAGDTSAPAGGGPIVTNLATGEHFLEVDGARVVGRTEGGLVVIERLDGETGPVGLDIRPRHDGIPELARRVSFVTPAAALLLFAIVRLLARRRRGQGDR